MCITLLKMFKSLESREAKCNINFKISPKTTKSQEEEAKTGLCCCRSINVVK